MPLPWRAKPAEQAIQLDAAWQRLITVTRDMSAPVTSRPRWPTAWSTWMRSATSSSRGSGCSR